MIKPIKDGDSTNLEADRQVILKTLTSTPLFDGLGDAVIEKLAENCELRNFSYHQSIWDEKKQKRADAEKKGTPLMIVASGCAAIVEKSDYSIKRINALVMPCQLMGEFQFLKDGWRPQIEIKAFDVCSVVFMDQKLLHDLVEDHGLTIYKNLSETLMEKLIIANCHFVVAQAGNAAPKLAVFLDKILDIPGWRQLCDEIVEDKEYQIGIYWDFDGLSQILSCTARSLKPALNRLMEKEAIETHYFDSQLTSLGKGVVGSKPPKETWCFQIKVINKSELLRFLE